MRAAARFFALACSAILLGGAVTATYAADDKPKVSKNIAKPLQAAKEAMDKKNYAEGLAKLKEVEALSPKSPYDEYLIAELYGFGYVRTNQYAEAAKYLEQGLNSG